jgi:hypothetical protein
MGVGFAGMELGSNGCGIMRVTLRYQPDPDGVADLVGDLADSQPPRA